MVLINFKMLILFDICNNHKKWRKQNTPAATVARKNTWNVKRINPKNKGYEIKNKPQNRPNKKLKSQNDRFKTCI